MKRITFAAAVLVLPGAGRLRRRLRNCLQQHLEHHHLGCERWRILVS